MRYRSQEGVQMNSTALCFMVDVTSQGLQTFGQFHVYGSSVCLIALVQLNLLTLSRYM